VEKGLKYTVEAVKKFGVRTILGALSGLAWFFLPFIVWVQIYQYLGQSFFVGSWAIPGIVILLFQVVFLSSFSVQLIRLDKKLMKHVEHAKSVFADPSDLKSEENFRQECNKFIVPYLHYPRLFPSGFHAVFGGFGSLRRVVFLLLQALGASYLSYALMVFLTTYQSFLGQICTRAFSSIPYLLKTADSLLPYFSSFFQNPIPSTALIFLISLYSTSSFLRQGFATYLDFVLNILIDSFSIAAKVSFLGASLASLPWLIKERSSTLKYEPFTFPISLPLIIQQSVRNIENKECNVTKWAYLVKDESDIERLKYAILSQKDFPSLAKLICSRADSEVALDSIRKAQPILYLGIIENRCSIIGRIRYDPFEKMFRGSFRFDNQHVRKQFKSIAEMQIVEQKRLKQQLPTILTGLLDK